MRLEDLRSLLEYHYWARDRMLAALDALAPELYTRDLGSSFRSIRDTAVHIYAAEWAWYARWQGESPTALLQADTFADVGSLRRTWVEHEAKMRAFLEESGDRGADCHRRPADDKADQEARDADGKPDRPQRRRRGVRPVVPATGFQLRDTSPSLVRPDSIVALCVRQ